MRITRSWVTVVAVLALPLAASVAGCSSSDNGSTGGNGNGDTADGGGGTGDNGGNGGDAGGGGTDGGGGGGGSTKIGSISLSSSTFKVASTTIATHSASAFFADETGAAGDTGGTSTGCTTTTDGSCTVVECQAKGGDGGTVGGGDGGKVKSPTAGEIDLSGGKIAAAGIKLTPNGDGLYTADSGQTAIWDGGEDISVKALGDAVPAFDQKVKAPSAVTLTKPAWPAPGTPLAVNRANALDLQWTGGSAGDVTVLLSSAGGGKSAVITCKFPSAGGTGTVPASSLGKLAAGAGVVSMVNTSTNAFKQGDWAINLTATSPVLAGSAVASGQINAQ